MNRDEEKRGEIKSPARELRRSIHADLADVPFCTRAEAAEGVGRVPLGIHRRPILSRDLAERHARKVADMRAGAYPSTRA